ncbi:MAG: alpha/beta hydrolase [Ruminococcaceae bacterium]|nr:alpha/beta hydrolase [Oscillospiraceae bacterium]
MFWNLRESSVTIGKSKADYAVFGNGKTPLVIIPGLSLRDVKGAGAGLALMYKLFAKDYRVYVIDKKADIAEGCTVSDLADDTAEAMIALGITDAYLLGVSLGGMIAQEIAIRYPMLVKKLVLGVTASRTNTVMTSVIEKWVFLAEKSDFASIVKDMMNVMYSKDYVKRYGWLFPVLAKIAKPKNEIRFIRLAKACLTCNIYDRLDNIKCPTLVIGGSDDKIVTGEASVEIAEKLGCEIHMYEALGHSAYEEATDFNKKVYDFLR